MTTALAAKLMPYFSYFLYAQLLLLCLAVLVGSILLIKRILGRPVLSGDARYDKEKIAREIDVEIDRLEDLRHRILPGERVRKVAGDAAGPAVIDPNSPEVEALFEERYRQKTEALKADFERRLQELSAASEAGKNSDAGLEEKIKALESSKESELGQLRRELESSQKITRESVERTKHLENVVADYQIFEEDLAFIKKYKSENEALMQKIASVTGEGIAPRPPEGAKGMAVTTEEIANIFNEMKGSNAEVAVEAPAPAPIAASVAAPVDNDDLEARAAIAAELGHASFIEDKVTEGPSIEAASNKKEEKAPSVEETSPDTAADNDSLMAEFEKLLGGESKT